MFDSMKIEHRLDKAAFKQMEHKLREDLLDAQAELIAGKARSILVLLNGADGAGKGAVLNQLYGWLDARKLVTLTYEAPSDDERARPAMWRYWRDMPANGEIGIVLGSWYHDVLSRHVAGKSGREQFLVQLEAINRFERMLWQEGVYLLKLWLAMEPEKAWSQFSVLKAHPAERPLVREWSEFKSHKQVKRLDEAATEAFRLTSTAEAPWIVVPASDPHYRDATVGEAMLAALHRTREPDRAVAPGEPVASPGESVASPSALEPTLSLPAPSLLATLDYTLTLDEKTYRSRLEREQARITRLTSSRSFRHGGLVCVFEGSDAAGKSSTIMRLREALDPRRFRVHPISAPSDEERARPNLWRFWRSIPKRGHVAVFDRSWYGRVLVEHVEGFTPVDAVSRAYGEINDFEHQLSEAGYVVAKFWLAITPEEQARRFQERETVGYKRFKLTPEDWRNRAKWPLYDAAVTVMVDRTSTHYAPWTLVEAESKRWARIKVLSTIADRLEAELG